MNKKINLQHSQLIRKLINATVLRYIRVAKFLAVNNNSKNPIMELAGMEKSKTGKVGLNVDDIYNND